VKPISPTGVFPTTVEPPVSSISISLASMSSTSMTITGPGVAPCSRLSIPPLMKPDSVGPLSLLGPDVTIV
jgi:hypothetical protein